MNIIGTIGVLLFLIIIVFWIASLRRKENLKRTLRLSFLCVTLPKKDSQLDEKQETARDFKETISIMEQLLSGLKSIQSGKLRTKIFGEDHFSLEYIAHQ